jgi:small GTP-binding protein
VIQKKVVVLGAPGVGKTSLVRRFVSGGFTDSPATASGVKVDRKVVTVDDEDLLLMVWDHAGDDPDCLPDTFVKGAAGCLLVVDASRAGSAERALDLVEQVERVLAGPVPMVVALSKADLAAAAAVDDPAMAEVRALGCPMVRSSAKTADGVEETFRRLVDQLV